MAHTEIIVLLGGEVLFTAGAVVGIIILTRQLAQNPTPRARAIKMFQIAVLAVVALLGLKSLLFFLGNVL